MTRPPPVSTLFPYTTLFRSLGARIAPRHGDQRDLRPAGARRAVPRDGGLDRAFPRCQNENYPREEDRRSALGLAYRSEEHTSELQSQFHLVCRLLLEKKNNQ